MEDKFSFTPNENFKYYMYFISERMNIFWNRLEGKNQPYSEDSIFQKYKFTNVYRSLDRVSQYLIKNVIYNGKNYSREDMFWRILIFKHFNKIDTWEYLLKNLGDITFKTTKEELIKVLKVYSESGKPLYSNAFMLTAPFMRQVEFMKEFDLKAGSPKYNIYLSIFYKHFKERGNIKSVLESKSLEELYTKLRETPAFANFLAMQFTIDFNYSELFDFDENDFVIASVGSQRGIERCFDLDKNAIYNDVIYWVHENFDELCEIYDVKPRLLPNRKPTLIDIQNCFCESDKLLRGKGIVTEGKEVYGKRIKNKFVENNAPITYIFPPKWKVGNLKRL